jgi:hypothetical protein
MGGARPPPFTLSTFTYKAVVYALAEGADTFPLFLLYPYMYSVVAAMQHLMYMLSRCPNIVETSWNWNLGYNIKTALVAPPA